MLCIHYLLGWRYSIDDGKSWKALTADNPEDSSEAIDEAARITNTKTYEWDVIDED